ncbi:MAG: DUF1858 domain-containing protein [bacterium]|nr:DUF1858 domain-containing protein [bacterium]
MKQQIKLTDSIYSICKEHAEVADLLESLGFTDIKKPGMLATMGRIMTIEKASKMKNIPLESIQELFSNHGFELI